MVDQDVTDTVYQVLDRALKGGPVPPGAMGLIHRAIDDLRVRSRAGIRLELAERISLQLHRIESTLHLRDDSISDLARAELKRLAACWINGRVNGPVPGRARRVDRVHPLA